MKTATAVIAAIVLNASAATLQAQPGTATLDASLTRRADSLTVGDYCALAQRIVADASVLTALADDSASARTNLRITHFLLVAPPKALPPCSFGRDRRR